MDEYRDKYGQELHVGAIVRLDESYDEDEHNVGDRTGRISSLPKEGTDWHGFPNVAFSGAKKASHHVPSSALIHMGK